MPPQVAHSANSKDTTRNVGGRAGRWTTEQDRVINAALVLWHTFSLETYRQLKGSDTMLTDWKKKKADEILQHPAFTNLPPTVSYFDQTRPGLTIFS
jgi:hypothetical protein